MMNLCVCVLRILITKDNLVAAQWLRNTALDSPPQITFKIPVIFFIKYLKFENK
jgi:hypothetical protein